MLPGAFNFYVGQTHMRALPKMPERVQRVIICDVAVVYVLYLFAMQGGVWREGGKRDGDHGCWGWVKDNILGNLEMNREN